MTMTLSPFDSGKIKKTRDLPLLMAQHETRPRLIPVDSAAKTIPC